MKYFLRQLFISSVPIILLGTLAFHLTCYDIRQTASDSAFKSLEQSRQLMNQILSAGTTIETTFNPDSFSGFSLKHILKEKELDYHNAIKYPIFSSILNTFVNTNPYVASVYLYWPNDYGNLLVSNKGLTRLKYMEDTDWLKDYSAFIMDRTRTCWIQPRMQNLSDKASIPVITIYQKIMTLDYQTSKGAAIINVTPALINDYLKQQLTFSQQQLYLFTEDWTLLASSDMETDTGKLQMLETLIEAFPSSFRQQPSDGNQIHIKKSGYTISILKDGNAPFLYASIIPDRQLYAVPAKLLFITGILVALSILASLGLAAANSGSISQNIQTIMDIFHAAQNGEPLPDLPVASNDEQSYIITNLISTFIKQEYLSVQLSEKIYRAKTLELVALQSQINPHFLFNTLETIHLKSFQLTGGPNDVSVLIENLSDIMHYTLSNPNERVSLENEIAYSKAYLYIQKFRYKDKFHIIWEYDSDILPIPVIKLLMQPLLENAIHHGIAPSAKECLLKIKIYQKEKLMYLHIIDTGIGMTPQQKEELLSHVLDDGTPYQHIGLSNTWKRLTLVYGDKASIRIRSKYQHGTAITLILPVFI
ncbi:MAG: histidine kinase [Lachnospiraceae bacterium]|nr:histidine kinase [Lachnospiraceae bacterium]